MEYKISVVIPTYRRPDLLSNCLKSLSAQRLDTNDFEVIVVSDGPDKLTERVVTEWISEGKLNIMYKPLREKKGPAAARNEGWKNASGKIIAFTDDDCLPDREWLQELWKSYHGEEKIAFTGKVVVPLSPQPTDYEMNTAGLETAEFVTANCMLTRKALELCGGFDEEFRMAWREDSDLHFKLIERDIPIVRLEKAVIVHPVRKAKFGVSIREQKKGMFNALLYKKFPALYRKRIQASPAWNYYIIISACLLTIAGLIMKNPWISSTSLIFYLLYTARFLRKRIARTSKALSHVLEMIWTSLAIPFVSVYWTLYGAVKYRVLFW